MILEFCLRPDDIPINSDDGRASAALDVLGELASQTQVLLFTHHSHVADMGTKADAQLIELGHDFRQQVRESCCLWT
jgi:uncharacterized protein YhaN